MPISYGPSLPPVPPGLTPFAIAILREQLEEDTLQLLLTTMLSVARNTQGVSIYELGATGYGLLDDTTSILAAIAQAKSNGSRFLNIPSGTYNISATLTISDVYGFTIQGTGRDKCTFKWIGASGLPMFKITNSQHVTFESFQILGNTTGANRPECAIESISDTTYARTFVPTNNIFRDLLIGTGSPNEFVYGFKFTNTGMSSDTNNSESIFENVKAQGVVEAIVYIGHAQSKAHHFWGCEFTSGKYGILQVNGSFTWHGGNCSAMTVAAFYLSSANDCISIEDCTSETCDRFLDVGSAGNAWTINVLGCRIAADAVNADKYIIRMGTKGPNTIRGCSFDTAACKIATAWQTAGGVMVVEDNSFNWLSSNVATIFVDTNQIGTWITGPNVFLDAGGTAAFRDYRVISTEGALHGNVTAALEVNSTSRGFLPPRMTTAQRNAITSPAEGLVIYNTTTRKLNVYTSAWEAVTSV